jgi:hypothetical protein
MLMPALTLNDLRTSMNEGAHYFCYEPSGNGAAQAPKIDSISVDRINHTITIHGSNYTAIQWVSGIQGSGSTRTSNVIATGSTFSWGNFYQPYVRAILINANGRTYTQPFGFDDKAPEKADTILGNNSSCFVQDTLAFSITPDPLASSYHWAVPAGATILSGHNTHQISVDFSAVAQNGEISVWKENISGIGDTTYLPVLIDMPSMGGTVTGGDTICLGSNAPMMTLTNQTSDIVKWQSSINGITWNDIANTLSTYVPGAITQSSHFRAVVKNGVCPEDYSASDAVEIDMPSVGGSVSGDTSICEGNIPADYLLFNQTGNVLAWQWSNDGMIWIDTLSNATMFNPGTLLQDLHVRAIVKNGVCDADTSESTLTNVHPIPAKPVITKQGTQLFSSSTNGNQWHNHQVPLAGETGPTFTPQVNGIYYVIVTLMGCSSYTSDVMTINTGISEPALLVGNVYPNPTQGLVHIDLISNQTSPTTIKALTLTGQQVAQVKAEDRYEGVFTIDLSHLPEGVYLISLSNDTSKTIQKVIVRK